MHGLRATTSKLSLMDDRICDTFFSLAELCEVCSEGSKFRPFCGMVSGFHLTYACTCIDMHVRTADCRETLVARGGEVWSCCSEGYVSWAFLCRVRFNGRLCRSQNTLYGNFRGSRLSHLGHHPPTETQHLSGGCGVGEEKEFGLGANQYNYFHHLFPSMKHGNMRREFSPGI